MVHLTLDRPYTVHARSTDRSGSALTTPSQYKLVLRDPITCNDDKYMVATLISAKVPSTFYQIDGKNNTFTVGFNRTRFSMFAQYADIPLQDADAGKTERADYLVEVTVKIQKGNYNIEELLAEIKTKLNDACTESAETEDFRTFLRSDDTTSSLYVEDHADGGGDNPAYTKDYVYSTPQFDWSYSKQLNKVKLFRTDIGGKMALGKFDFTTTGVKLAIALGFNHVTAQQMKLLNATDSSTVENSVHYRETDASVTEYYDFSFPRTAGSPHAIYSLNCVNMFGNDSVYVHIANLPSNAYTTLTQASTTVMAVIPMYAGSSSENFHTPSNPTSTNIGSMVVSELDIKMTDAMGQAIDFNGVEHEFQLLFEVFEKGTRADKPDDPNYLNTNARNAFANLHPHAFQRHSAPMPTATLPDFVKRR
jgi:hypothetical protein